jgi:hypothetical protein
MACKGRARLLAKNRAVSVLFSAFLGILDMLKAMKD